MRNRVQAGNFGLPQPGAEEGLPCGELFEILPVLCDDPADLAIQIEVLASIGMRSH